MTTVALADDHALVRHGLRAILSGEPDIDVVGEAANGRAAVELVEKLHPDVLLLDLMMPELGGLDAAREVRRRSPQTKVIVLSMHANDAYVVEALRSGASAYVLKDGSADEVVRAVKEVAAGKRYLSPTLESRGIDADQPATGARSDAHESLTRREREVLHLVAEGHSNTSIGARLEISPRTVEIHRANVMRKLSLRTHADLIRYALRRGLIPLGE